MAVYILTIHAYCSWMPDHPGGYVDNSRGIMPADEGLGTQYREYLPHHYGRFWREPRVHHDQPGTL